MSYRGSQHKHDPGGNSWLDRAFDAVFGEGSFNRTFGDEGSAWSDRTFGNASEKWAGEAYKRESVASRPNATGPKNENWWEDYEDYKNKRIEWASGSIVASNVDIDIALTVTGIGPAYKAGKAAVSAIRASLNPNRVFWTGRSATTGVSARVAAEEYAKTNGATTLEMTVTGKILDLVTTKRNFKSLEPIWEAASGRFASGAEKATVFQGTISRGAASVWERVEKPVLESRAIDYATRIFD